jgi:hypothetical protein
MNVGVWSAIGVAFGLVLSFAVGVSPDYFGTGIAIGAGIGAAIGFALRAA